LHASELQLDDFALTLLANTVADRGETLTTTTAFIDFT